MLLETSRLISKNFNNSDVPDWAKIEGDVDVRRFADVNVLSFEGACEYVENNSRQYQTYGYGR